MTLDNPIKESFNVYQKDEFQIFNEYIQNQVINAYSLRDVQLTQKLNKSLFDKEKLNEYRNRFVGRRAAIAHTRAKRLARETTI